MQAIIAEIIQETSDISSFRLIPESPLKFVPGQWMYVRLSPELKHHFTISASPSENFLQFTTKNTGSDYKKALWKKKTGEKIEINGSFGNFTLDENDSTPRIFIAGGIGITPFRSMVKYIQDRALSLSYTLIYSVKTAEEIAFKELLSGNANVKIVETEKDGRLDGEKIKKYCPDWQQSSLWLCGPPSLVEAFVEIGQKMGLAPEKIKSEEFTGYA